MVAELNGTVYVVGVTASGFDCGVEDGVYTAVPVYLQWITEVISKFDPVGSQCFPVSRHQSRFSYSMRSQDHNYDYHFN